jgi:hypothetical protein
MTFPHWAPVEVVEHLCAETSKHESFLARFAESEAASGRKVPQSILDEPDPELEMLHRLVTREEMRIAWASINKYNVDPMLVVHACVLGFIGPTRLQRLSPSERQKRIDDIRETALRLANLVADTEYEEIQFDKWREQKTGVIIARAFAAGFGGETLSKDTSHSFFPDKLSDLLRSIARFDPSIRWEVDSSRPGANEASRHALIRRLDQLFQEKAGRRLRTTVARFASAAFDADIGERQVIRIAP